VELGIRRGALNPFAGIDIAWITVSYDEKDESEYLEVDSPYYFYHHRSLDKYEFSGSAFIIVPNIGAKFYFNTDFSPGSIAPYLKGSLFFSLPIINGESTEKNYDWYYDEEGQVEEYYYYYDKWKLEGKEKDMVEDILAFWGINLFGGCEYYFSDRFSIGGEFGLRLLFNNIKASDEDSDQWGDPDSGYYGSSQDSWESEVSATFKITQALINLNYSF